MQEIFFLLENGFFFFVCYSQLFTRVRLDMRLALIWSCGLTPVVLMRHLGLISNLLWPTVHPAENFTGSGVTGRVAVPQEGSGIAMSGLSLQRRNLISHAVDREWWRERTTPWKTLFLAAFEISCYRNTCYCEGLSLLMSHFRLDYEIKAYGVLLWEHSHVVI